MKLSIVIACLNDAEIFETVRSIRETAGDKPEICVCDDCGILPLQFEAKYNVKVIYNTMRCGVGPSRTIAALNATGEYLLIVDAHMRFTEGWYDAAIRRIEGRPMTLHCATCLGLDAQNMDVNTPKGVYRGATMNVLGPDRNSPGKTQVLEPVWGPQVPDDTEIPAVMGACYFIKRDYFLKLNPLAHLRFWGGDELQLSLKVWLSGGDIRYVEPVRVGHKFWTGFDRQRFNTPPGVVTYNKVFGITTLVVGTAGEKLSHRLKDATSIGEWQPAMQMARDSAHVIAVEQAFNRTIFKRDFRWYCEKFGLNYPG